MKVGEYAVARRDAKLAAERCRGELKPPNGDGERVADLVGLSRNREEGDRVVRCQCGVWVFFSWPSDRKIDADALGVRCESEEQWARQKVAHCLLGLRVRLGLYGKEVRCFRLIKSTLGSCFCRLGAASRLGLLELVAAALVLLVRE